eukprot:3474263-Pyramimonas_sp.AAC.2
MAQHSAARYAHDVGRGTSPSAHRDVLCCCVGSAQPRRLRHLLRSRCPGRFQDCHCWVVHNGPLPPEGPPEVQDGRLLIMIFPHSPSSHLSPHPPSGCPLPTPARVLLLPKAAAPCVQDAKLV